jgi:hypothetical protein
VLKELAVVVAADVLVKEDAVSPDNDIDLLSEMLRASRREVRVKALDELSKRRFYGFIVRVMRMPKIV